MIKVDEDALICDMAETYHIYNCRALPARLYAVYAVGLGQDSRIKRKILGKNCTDEMMLLAMIADSLRTLVWFKTKDGQKGRNRPPSILEALTKSKDEIDAERPKGFTSGADFEEYRNYLLKESR